jgi:hypothetical protein
VARSTDGARSSPDGRTNPRRLATAGAAARGPIPGYFAGSVRFLMKASTEPRSNRTCRPILMEEISRDFASRHKVVREIASREQTSFGVIRASAMASFYPGAGTCQTAKKTLDLLNQLGA